MPVSRFEVQDWMTPAPETVDPECTVTAARRTMDAGGFRHLPVVEEGRVIGIVSDRDLRSAWRSIEPPAGRKEVETHLDRITVRQVMTQKPLVVGPHTSLADAARLLVDHGVGALPVLAGEEIVGILSESDALRALMSVLALIQGSRRGNEVWQE
jgi:acetoin utilization protein AcuB